MMNMNVKVAFFCFIYFLLYHKRRMKFIILTVCSLFIIILLISIQSANWRCLHIAIEVFFLNRNSFQGPLQIKFTSNNFEALHLFLVSSAIYFMLTNARYSSLVPHYLRKVVLDLNMVNHIYISFILFSYGFIQC